VKGLGREELAPAGLSIPLTPDEWATAERIASEL
jgi:hypothetical protein